MATKASLRQTKYDKTHCRTYGLKLNLENDADIIEKLASVPSMQGYIKQLIREDIARTRSVSKIESEKNTTYNWEYIVSLMDDNIRESVHADLADCYDSVFLEEYKKRHYEKYGTEFTYWFRTYFART